VLVFGLSGKRQPSGGAGGNQVAEDVATAQGYPPDTGFGDGPKFVAPLIVVPITMRSCAWR